MPELPDLQVFSKNLLKPLKGKKLKKISVQVNKSISTSEDVVNKKIAGAALKDVYRKGKKLYFDFGKAVLAMHLMLHGKLVWQEGEEPAKYALVTFYFEQAPPLVLTDFQKMAHMELDPEPDETVDALSKQMTADWLWSQTEKSKKAIKTLLMDQHIIGGIGNAYADEILWEARIAPQSIAAKIPKPAVVKLAKAIQGVLTEAEKQIGKARPDSISGEYRDFLAVHGRKKNESPTGHAIKNDSIGGRTSYYTDEQELFK